MNIHPKVLEAIDEIDAAFFSGDCFHNEDSLKEIERMLIRWAKEASNIREILNQRIDGDLP